MKRLIIVALAIVAVAAMAFSYTPITKGEVTSTNDDVLEQRLAMMKQQIATIEKMKVGSKILFHDVQGKVMQEVVVTEEYKKERLTLLNVKMSRNMVELLLSPPPCGGAGCEMVWGGIGNGTLCCCSYQDCDGEICQTWTYCYPI